MSDTTEQKFNKAVYYIKNGPSQASSNETKLSYYKFFKQATCGNVSGSQPWKVQLESRAKWDAWNSCKGMSKENAMNGYVNLLTTTTPSWDTHEVMKGFGQ